MNLVEFLSELTNFLRLRRIRFCVLRNHAGLPFTNVGNDIDILVSEATPELLNDLITGLPKVFLTNITDRGYVMSVFLHGVFWGDGKRAIQIDFVRSLTWKGLRYLSEQDVFECSRAAARSESILVPSPAHEAIVTMFSSYLVGGWVNEKYQEEVRQAFRANRSETMRALVLALPSDAQRAAFVDAVVNDDRDALKNLLRHIRMNLLLQNMRRSIAGTLQRVALHYLRELRLTFSQRQRWSVCFLGPDGAGKTTLIEGILPRLRGTAKVVERVHLRPRRNAGKAGGAVDNPHGAPARSTFLTSLKFLAWVPAYAADRWLTPRRNSTLRIWDRYFHDAMIDPLRYRSPRASIARRLAVLVPEPSLWVVLDAPAKVMHERKRETTLSEMERARRAYLEFAAGKERSLVLDTARPVSEVLDQAEWAIVQRMAGRVAKRLKRQP